MKINYKMVLLVTLLQIFLISNVVAITDLKGFPRDTPINLQFPCRTYDGGTCGTDFNCSLTMQYPNTTVAYNNFQLTRTSASSAYYNITLPNGIPIGDYNNVEVYCTNGNLNGTESYQFTVRGAGSIPTVTEGLIYLIVIFICTLVLFLSLWGIFGIKGGDEIDSDGSIINVNNLKYLKIFLTGIAYIMMVILAYFGMGISYNFLSINLATNIFQWIFEILMYGIIPFSALLFVFLVIKWTKDLKIKKALSMGGEYHV